MELRDARASDVDGIARVAAESVHESYGDFIDGDAIDDLVDQWYDEERVSDLANRENVVFTVGEDGGDVVGFAQAAVLDTEPIVGEIDWLLVAPDARGAGLARQLLGQVQQTAEKRGADVLRGLVLADNEAGADFYEGQGFDRVDERDVSVGDREYAEFVYEKTFGDTDAGAVVEAVDGPEGELFVNFSDAERGIDAPFYPTYRTRELDERYGWYCSQCESVSTAMGSMGRIACNDCGNERKATRWDNSYL